MCLPSPDFFENASAAQRVAGVRRLILHAPIDFLRFEDLRSQSARATRTPSLIAFSWVDARNAFLSDR